MSTLAQIARIEKYGLKENYKVIQEKNVTLYCHEVKIFWRGENGSQIDRSVNHLLPGPDWN